MSKVVVHWFRRDLRLEDNTALSAACRSGYKVIPVFIFDQTILSKLDNKHDARVNFIHQQLTRMTREIEGFGGGVIVKYGHPREVFTNLLKTYEIEAVYANTDYEPDAIRRDEDIKSMLKDRGVAFYSLKDQVIFHQSDIMKDDGTPYTVFTPYSKKWKAALDDNALEEQIIDRSCFLDLNSEMPSLKAIGFSSSNIPFPEKTIDPEILANYADNRDIPAVSGTTRISVHLRFGTVSIRRLVTQALSKSDKWLMELIWREFYQMALFHHPQVVHQSFRSKYDRIEWRNNENEFEKWCTGETGYPIVDAGMRELNATGFMHNRVRMVVASFLTKHLLIDWRWGERYFAEKLLDFELASNIGGWQWASGSGFDAAPYFRIFNPELQQKRFDPDFRYIKKWIPELDSVSYPDPVVNHKKARQRALEVYARAVK